MKKTAIYIGILLLLLTAFLGCQNGPSQFTPDTSQNQGMSSVSLQTVILGNYVWNDENMDGIQNEDEIGLGDIAVTLYDCEENLIGSTTTNDNGFYYFEQLEAGEYSLGFEVPDDYQFSPMDQSDDEAIDSDPDPETGMTECFALEADSENLGWDAGMFVIADDGCTYGKGFWKNHCGMGPQDDLVSDLLPLWLGDQDGEYSMNVETVEMAYEILGQHTYGHPSNGITKLYAHFLTTKLNIANGANDEDIADLIGEVDEFIAAHGYEGWDELSQEERQMVNQWKGMLEGYNEGEIGPGSCHDYMVN